MSLSGTDGLTQLIVRWRASVTRCSASSRSWALTNNVNKEDECPKIYMFCGARVGHVVERPGVFAVEKRLAAHPHQLARYRTEYSARFFSSDLAAT